MVDIVDVLQERKDLPPLFLERDGLIGIELGVAAGWYSRRLRETGLFAGLYGVDVYGDHHDTAEYVRALKNVGGIGANYWLLRMRFDEALSVFPDAYFDFIYIDGYAHTGELRGKTMFDWFPPKLKVGGMIAGGHDYHEAWPLVQVSVDGLADCLDQPVLRTAMSENPDPQDHFPPSWAMIKQSTANPAYPDHLRQLPETLRG